MRTVALACLVLFVACADHGTGGAMATCGGDVADGAGCLQPTTCFKPNPFSGCASEVCACSDGRYTCHGIHAAEGASCEGSPLASCSYEGNPSCDALPTIESCGCDADGTWHCTCACYSSQSTCSTLCPRDFTGAHGARCAGTLSCPYAEGTCTCQQDPDGMATLHCMP